MSGKSIKKMLSKLYVKVAKRLLRLMPRFARVYLMRRFIKLPEGLLPDDLIIKVADSTDELEGAFQLVYENYLELGYCEENEYKMRATLHHALPTTSTLVAISKGEVVGTLTLVRDNRLGLPLERYFTVGDLRKNVRRTAEVTALVIHKNYRRQNNGQILFMLMKLMYEYATSYFGVTYLLVGIHPKDFVFYESLFSFQRLPGNKVVDCLGAPAMALFLDCEAARKEYEGMYATQSAGHHLYTFFLGTQFSNIVLPERKFNKVNDAVVTLSYYLDLFVMKLKLTAVDRRSVEACIKQDEQFNNHLRVHPRVDVEAAAHLHGANESYPNPLKFRIKDVSRAGFRIDLHEGFVSEQEFEVEVKVSDTQVAVVKAKVKWVDAHFGVGFEILQADDVWHHFVNYLYEDHLRTAS